MAALTASIKQSGTSTVENTKFQDAVMEAYRKITEKVGVESISFA